jgi:putative endonuclease
MSGQESRLLGAWGEDLAARWVREQGGRVIAANFRCRFGEIDLIVKNKKYLAFVEVKLRKSDRFAAAMEYVDRRKQDRLRMTASLYLSRNETKLQPRFDVIEIYAPDGMDTANPEIIHLEDAFQ